MEPPCVTLICLVIEPPMFAELIAALITRPGREIVSYVDQGPVECAIAITTGPVPADLRAATVIRLPREPLDTAAMVVRTRRGEGADYEIVAQARLEDLVDVVAALEQSA